MRLSLTATVRGSDGAEVGRVAGIVMEERRYRITHLVVSAGTTFSSDKRVPLEAVARGVTGGDSVQLRLTGAEVEMLPALGPAFRVVPPSGWVIPAAYVAVSGPVPGRRSDSDGGPWEDGEPASSGVPAQGNPNDSRESPLVRLGRGAAVYDAHGSHAGVVSVVDFDATRGRLHGFTVRQGGVLRTLLGGGSLVEIPAGLVARIAEHALWLGVARQALIGGAGAAPGAPRERP
jgi:sporulation protein YlmC with PRC-barrel domain